MERVRCARAVCGGIGKRVDDLELLDDRAGPPVRDDERQRYLDAYFFRKSGIPDELGRAIP
jgi:hypothetical protein